MEPKRDNPANTQQPKPKEAAATDARSDKKLTDEDTNKVVGGFNPQPDPPGDNRRGG